MTDELKNAFFSEAKSLVELGAKELENAIDAKMVHGTEAPAKEASAAAPEQQAQQNSTT